MAGLEREELKLVFVGHVDHGKSTIIGRLLADTGSLPEGKLEAIQEKCRRNARPFEYAFLLDALKDEQAQGITIDVARSFFKTAKRNYLIIDAPGHIEFLKNMVTGASWADAAFLVIDAGEGVQENSRRHGYMLSMLGIDQVCVLVNKMDLVNYDEGVFKNIEEEYRLFLDKIGIQPLNFIPVSGQKGDIVVELSKNMPWYGAPTVLQQLDDFRQKPSQEDKPFRMPVQDVYKFTENGDNRRIIAGWIETGSLAAGDEIVFYPSKKKSTVNSIELFPEGNLSSLNAGNAVGITLSEQIYVRRGELAARSGEPEPQISTRFKASIFWLGKEPLQVDKKYLFKMGTGKVEMEIESVLRVMNASSLEQIDSHVVMRHDVGECIVKLDQMAAFDIASDISETGRFVIVDDYEISGGGVITEALSDHYENIRQKIHYRNLHWEHTPINLYQRAERYNQVPCLLLITGSAHDTLRKQIAKELERCLFEEGKFVYYIGMASILYGMEADIHKIGGELNGEHVRRMAEIANIMLDAGTIFIISARELTRKDQKILDIMLLDRFSKPIVVWAGNEITTDIKIDIHLREDDHYIKNIKAYLQKSGKIFEIKIPDQHSP